MTRRRPGAGALCVLAALATVVVGPLAAPGFAAAPTAQGWWSSAHQGVQPPTPPDVPADGLLVQGAAAPGAPGVGGTPAEAVSVQALSALTFVVPTGSVVESLKLKLAGDPPESTSVYACVVTGPYKPVQNGAFADRPPFDCKSKATPVLDPVGGTLGFGSDLAGLVRKGSLSFVLLPGGADRLVLQKPGAAALVLAESGGSGASDAPAFDPGTPPALQDPSTGGPSFGSGTSGSGEVPLGSDLGSGTAVAPSLGAAGTPAVAAPQAAPALGGPRTGATNPTVAGAVDGSTRTWLLLGLVVVGLAFVLGSREGAAPAAPAVPVPIPPQERGIGRFRQMRNTRAVPL